MSGGLDPDPHPDLSSFKIAIETLGLSTAVVQSVFANLACLRVDIRYLLHAWVIIHSYDDHVRLLLPNLPSSMLQSLTGPQWSRQCYEIKGTNDHFP
jgi:hypothetical protein